VKEAGAELALELGDPAANCRSRHTQRLSGCGVSRTSSSLRNEGPEVDSTMDSMAIR
jgi:hypothetical protein